MNSISTNAVEFLGKFLNLANWELRNCFYAMYNGKNVEKAMKCKNANAMQKNLHRIAKKWGKRENWSIDRSFAIAFASHYQPWGVCQFSILSYLVIPPAQFLFSLDDEIWPLWILTVQFCVELKACKCLHCSKLQSASPWQPWIWDIFGWNKSFCFFFFVEVIRLYFYPVDMRSEDNMV